MASSARDWCVVYGHKIVVEACNSLVASAVYMSQRNNKIQDFQNLPLLTKHKIQTPINTIYYSTK